MKFAIRFALWVVVGIPLMLCNAWVFGQKLWPYFVHPVAPTLFVETLDITAAIGFALVNGWLAFGITRILMVRTPDPSKDEIQLAIDGYITSLVFTLIIWGMAEVVHWFQ